MKRKKKGVKRSLTIKNTRDGLKITACLILKNEGRTIYRCLDSIKDFVDEYVIGIDESTDDNTHKEVTKFFEKNKINHNVIYKYKWQNDFSKARNEGMDKATGDYILIMDGHEYFPDEWFNITEQKMIKVKEALYMGGNNVRKILIEQRPDEAYFQLYQQPFIGTTPNNFFLQPRIYRNDPEIRFNRAAHNTIKNTKPENQIHFPEVILIHDAPDDNRLQRKAQRVKMNTEELLKKLKETPQDTRTMFYLGNTYMEAKKWKKALRSFENYLKTRKDESSEKYQVLIHKALCLKELEKWADMRDCIQIAKGMNPFRRDAHLLLADMYIHLKKWDNAIYELTAGLRLNPQASRMFQNGAGLTWDPHQKLAMCYEKVGQIPKAIAHLSQALKYFNNEKWRELLVKWRDNKQNILILDEVGSFTKEFADYLKKDFNIVVATRYDNRLVRWADYIWCEWATENAYLCSKNFPEKTVVRLHGYEAYVNGFETMIEWDKLKKVVFVAEHIKDRMKTYITNGKAIVSKNGINIDKYFIKKKNRDSKNVGIVGYMNSKKNPMLLAEIIKKYRGLKFHLRIDWQDPFLKAGFEHEVKNCKNIVYHGRYNDLNDFWNKMSMVISTSIIESFSFNIGEAMACGCKPLIYNWKGAKSIWNSKWIFNDISELNMMIDKEITDEERGGYRDYIIQNYPLNKSLKSMKEILIQKQGE